MEKKYILKKLDYLVGQLAEIVAILHLKSKGFCLLHERYRSIASEIDIISYNNSCIVFAEVKFRKSVKDVQNYIDYQDCKKIYSSAEYFLQQNPIYLKHIPLFKLFLFTPRNMKILDLY